MEPIKKKNKTLDQQYPSLNGTDVQRDNDDPSLKQATETDRQVESDDEIENGQKTNKTTTVLFLILHLKTQPLMKNKRKKLNLLRSKLKIFVPTQTQSVIYFLSWYLTFDTKGAA